ncbi:MAG TPA: hypothetical protein VG844_10775 [Terracidiphilus sp.]|nr:hypothetical protein [Terracidiphilus sp.]
MKIILSRKGFDSTSGGVPSPIFPDGRMLSLPIPDKQSQVAYQDIRGYESTSMGELVSQLASIPRTHRAHLDPDISRQSISRLRGWRPIFGQVGSSEGHLRNQQVGRGDVFLFFGLFRRIEQSSEGWRYVREAKPMHVLFGWLQVAERIPVSSWSAKDHWALYHPHFSRHPHRSNVIYASSKRLQLPHRASNGIAGAGTFQFYSPKLRLSAPDSNRPSQWLLPEWFSPIKRKSTLSFHSDAARWEKAIGGVTLSSVSRGQEFVLNCDHYPEAIPWLRGLLSPA